MEEKNPIPTEEKNPKLLKTAIIAVCVLAAFACFYFGMQYIADNKPSGIPIDSSSSTGEPAQSGASTQNTASPTPVETPIPIYSETPALAKKLTFDEAMNICQKIATKHLGEGTMILPDFEGNLIEVTFDGKTRPCYVFIGGDIEYMLAPGNPEEAPARYIVDITNGDVFDTISKKYIK